MCTFVLGTKSQIHDIPMPIDVINYYVKVQRGKKLIILSEKLLYS